MGRPPSDPKTLRARGPDGAGGKTGYPTEFTAIVSISRLDRSSSTCGLAGPPGPVAASSHRIQSVGGVPTGVRSGGDRQ